MKLEAIITAELKKTTLSSSSSPTHKWEYSWQASAGDDFYEGGRATSFEDAAEKAGKYISKITSFAGKIIEAK